MDKPRPHLFGVLAGLFLAAGLVIAAMLLGRTWLKISDGESVSVTGSARKAVLSDLIVWKGVFAVESTNLLAAQKQLKGDLATVEAFLRDKGVTNYTVGTISIQERRSTHFKDGETTDRLAGFRLAQTIEISSPEVERIARLDRETVALVEQGVVFTTEAPKFIYSKAGEAKVEMLAEATKDARARADQIAVQGGRGVRQLLSARMGVFQITPIHTIQTSWDGMNDTSSVEKTVTAVVTATFSLK
jgi:hypothetical protein